MDFEVTLEEEIERICGRFANAWKIDQKPKVEEFWEPLSGDDSDRLFLDLIRMDIDHRYRFGEEISADIYLRPFPENAEIINKVFENLKKSGTHLSSNPTEFSTVHSPIETHLLATGVGIHYAGKSIGPYQLLRLLGSGGMGKVFLAEQEKPVRRKVALKLMKTDLGTPELNARFEIEVQALSLMNHPNIATILDIGKTASGIPYFATDYVQGNTLVHYCDQRQLSIRKRLELFCQICAAMSHAHRKGVLHRDLKPSNILVDEVNGEPTIKVIDFGLARSVDPKNRLTDNNSVTLPGYALGTLQYMSPEQADMTDMGLDTRTDVYSLGAILYELLTGTTPLHRDQAKNKGLHRVLSQIVDGNFQKPSDRLLEMDESIATVAANRQSTPHRLPLILRQELDWICEKALEKNRSLRYEGTAFLLSDIENYLNGDVVLARPPSLSYQLGKKIWKNRTLCSAALLLLGALIGGWWSTRTSLIIARDQQQKAKEAQRYSYRMEMLALEEARIAKQTAQTSRETERIALQREADASNHQAIAEKNSYVADMLLIQNEWKNGKDNQRVNTLLKKYRLRPNLRGFEWDYWHVQTNRLTSTLIKTGAPEIPLAKGLRPIVASSAVFTSDGQQVASIGSDARVGVWDSESGIELRRFPLPNPMNRTDTIVFSPDNQKLLITQGGSAVILDAETGKHLVAVGQHQDEPLLGARFNRDQLQIITAHTDDTLGFWDALTGRKIQTKRGMLPLSFSDRSPHFNQSFIDSASDQAKSKPQESRSLRILNIQNDSWTSIPFSQKQPHLTVSPGGYCLLFPDFKKITQIQPLGKQQEFEFPTGFFPQVRSAATDLTGQFIAVGNRYGQVCVWNLDRSEKPILIREATDSIESLDFCDDGTRLLSLESTGVLRVYDLHNKTFPTSVPALTQKWSVSGNRKYIVSFGGGKLRIYDPATKDPVREWLYPSKSAMASLAISNSGKYVAVAHHDGILKMLQTDSGQEVWNWKGPRGDSFANVSINSSENHVLFNHENKIMILRVTDGHVIRSWQAHKTPITCLEYHPDGKRIASATLFGIRFWDQTDAKLIWQFEHPPKSIHKIAFSEEGSVLAVAGDSVSVLNTETAELLCKVATESEILAVNQDGSRIATRAGTGDEGEAKIKFWEGKSGQEILSFDAPHSILWFSFGQGDRYLVGGRHDTRFIWDLSSAPDQPESPLGKRAK